MKTLFEQDDRYKVINKLRPENDFINDGCFDVHVKRDGTSCLIKDNSIYRRYDANESKGRSIPEGSISCQDEPAPNGSFPVWIKVVKGDPEDKHYNEAISAKDNWEDGTYELCGPKINGNRDKFENLILVKHDSEKLLNINLEFDAIKAYFEDNYIEGFVITDKKTGLKTKIRRIDYGLSWK